MARREQSKWKKEGKYLVRTIRFDNFLSGLYFVNNVAEIAEKMNHHPDVELNIDKLGR